MRQLIETICIDNCPKYEKRANNDDENGAHSMITDDDDEERKKKVCNTARIKEKIKIIISLHQHRPNRHTNFI